MRVVICDDDEAYIAQAQRALEAFALKRGLDVCLSSFTSISALLSSEIIASSNLVFMDVEFEGRPEGIDAARRINELAPNCQVVYLTDYIQYSVDVYQTDHVWFIVKSQFERRLPELFEKLARIEDAKRSSIVLTLKDRSVLNVSCQDVICFERNKRVTYITTTDAVHETPEKLSEIIKKLPEASFAYSHNSYVVNLSHIARIYASELVFDNGQVAPISRRYGKHFRNRYFDWAEQWTV